MKVSILWILSIILIFIFLMIFIMTKKETMQKKELTSQFECGFNMMNPSHIPFSFQFFLISLLFLIFDIEIALIISYPQEPTSTKKLFLMMTFLTILLIGLLYEWQKSKLDWSK